MEPNEIESEPLADPTKIPAAPAQLPPPKSATSEDIIQKRFEKEILKKYNEALLLLADGKLKAGIATIEQLLKDKRVTDSASANPVLKKFQAACHLNAFSAYMELQEIRLAIYHSLQYLKVYPKDFKRLFEIGCILFHNGFLKAGASILQRALSYAIESKELQFSLLIIDNLMECLFIIKDLPVLQKTLAYLESLPLFGAQSFSRHWKKAQYLEALVSQGDPDFLLRGYPADQMYFHELMAKAKSLFDKEALIRKEYWEDIARRPYFDALADKAIDEGVKTEVIAIKNVNMLSLIDRVNSILTKIQLPPAKAENGEGARASKRQSLEAIKVNYEDLVSKTFLLEFDKIERKSARDAPHEDFEEEPNYKLLDDYVVPKLLKIQNLSYISRILHEASLSLRAMFDVSSAEKGKRRGGAGGDKTTLSSVKLERLRITLELLNKLNGKNLLNIIKHILQEVFEETRREVQIGEKRFVFFGPHVFLRTEFKASCSEYLKLFNFAYQIFPSLLTFEALLVFLECFQVNIQDNSKKGYYKLFLIFFQKLEELYINLDDDYFVSKARQYSNFKDECRSQSLYFGLFEQRCPPAFSSASVIVIEDEPPGLGHSDNPEHNDHANFPRATLAESNTLERKPRNSNNMEIEYSRDAEKDTALTLSELVSMLKSDVKFRFLKLKRFEQRVRASAQEGAKQDKLDELVALYQEQIADIYRSNIDQQAMYWCEASVIKVTPKNMELVLKWVEHYFSVDEIEVLIELISFDFSELYKIESGAFKGLAFLPQLIDFILEFADKPKKYEGDKFEYVFDLLKDFFGLSSHLKSFLDTLKTMESMSLALPSWIADSQRFYASLIKLFLIDLTFDKKQHQIDCTVEMKLLLHHKMLWNKDKQYFLLFQFIHYIIDYSNFTNTLLISKLGKPIYKLRALGAINSILRNLSPDEFVVENKNNALNGINLVLHEVRRWFECVYQIKFPQTIFTNLIKVSVPEISKEVTELSKESKSEFPKLKVLCLMADSSLPSSAGSYGVKQFAESLFLFSLVINMLSRDSNIVNRLFVQSEPRFGEIKAFASKVSVLIFEDLRLDATLLVICNRIFKTSASTILQNFSNFCLHCLQHKKLKHFFNQEQGGIGGDASRQENPGATLDGQQALAVNEEQFLMSESIQLFVTVCIRYIEQQMLERITTGENLKDVSKLYALMEGYCKKIIELKLREGQTGSYLLNFLMNAQIRYRYQILALEPLEVALKVPNEFSFSSLEAYETLALHYFLAIRKLENHVSLLKTLSGIFGQQIEAARTAELVKTWEQNSRQFYPLLNLITCYSSKRIDYVMIFYTPEILVNHLGGAVEKVLCVLENFFRDAKEQDLTKYVGTFKTFFENKKGDKFLVYKVIAYAKMFVQFYHAHSRGADESDASASNAMPSEIRALGTPPYNLQSDAAQLLQEQPATPVLRDDNLPDQTNAVSDTAGDTEEKGHKWLDRNEKPESEEAKYLHVVVTKLSESEALEQKPLAPSNKGEAMDPPNQDQNQLFWNEVRAAEGQFQTNYKDVQSIQDARAENLPPGAKVRNIEAVVEEEPIPVDKLSFDQYVSTLWIETQKAFQQKFNSAAEGWHFMLKKIIDTLYKSKKFSSQIFLYDTLEIFAVAFKLHPQLREVFSQDLKSFFENFRRIEIEPKEKDFKTFFFEICISRKLLFLEAFTATEFIPGVTESLLVSSLKLVKSQDTVVGDLSILNAIMPSVLYLLRCPECKSYELFKAIWAVRGSFAKHHQKEPCILYAANFLIRKALRFMLWYFHDKKLSVVKAEEFEDFNGLCIAVESRSISDHADLETLFKVHKAARTLIHKHFVGEGKEK